jgi:hypothetical protein
MENAWSHSVRIIPPHAHKLKNTQRVLCAPVAKTFDRAIQKSVLCITVYINVQMALLLSLSERWS